MKLTLMTSDDKVLDLEFQSKGSNQIEFRGVERAKFQLNGAEVEIRETETRMEVWFKGQCVWPPATTDRAPVDYNSAKGLPWHRV